jgi:hypothetical protein
LDVRITGALVRLYALPLTRIVRLTVDDVHVDGHFTYLTLSRHPVVLPPKLADLVHDHLQRSGPLHRSPGASRYLVPGFNPDARATLPVCPRQ